jgi:hypothetical protein
MIPHGIPIYAALVTVDMHAPLCVLHPRVADRCCARVRTRVDQRLSEFRCKWISRRGG